MARKTKRKRHNSNSDWRLDWFEELSFWVAVNRHRVIKKKLDNGRYAYYVVDKFSNVVLTVESHRDLRFVRHKKRGRRNRRNSK